ncbi:bifunctional 4-hydroxy-2-oxoglutarate aldolase/2-dehydro-3-deoxy-phosphogluconate aldolase [Flavobacterium psychrotrophum]|uniref:bifunctional 4-hydroxy-2-oxoglutarate aldolase/2-dehydro-3-deoxy-phosphogluconate aldolase n=1 Tax=Flavobacterium psychrotrophum TaxID=2294119 RepID=UPI000E30E42B|nr:bifunctional 4-hydroxy-2-oxoglutarate aldolase/2-dehydro-3-deoxy-phosphogluconate aldolase [Flavobacterium psychrotrophum]
MGQFTKIQVLLALKETAIIPVFNHMDVTVCKEIIQACYTAGIRVFEFTNRGDSALQVFTAVHAYTKKHMPEMILGVGSVTDAVSAALYTSAGAEFIVSPLFNSEIARFCNGRQIVWIPGCGTVTEIATAQEAGSCIVKIFPAEQLGGPAFIKAVKGPMPWTNIMATGGITLDAEELQQWFKAGVYCVGFGSSVFKTLPDGSYDYQQIEAELSQAVNIVKSLSINM